MKTWQTQAALWEKLKPVCREMRRKPTRTEDSLWQRLRNRRLAGFRFRRQHSIERFVVDFYCPEADLIVEVDGPIHRYERAEDAIRQEFLEAQGLRVLRFSDEDVTMRLAEVLTRVSLALSSPSLQAEKGSGDEVACDSGQNRQLK